MMPEKSRTYNSIVNSLFGIGASIIVTILNFFVRVVLVRELGEEINGVHNLFQSIINVMTLMELGINTAMIIHLYAPVKEHDESLIKGIINFYRKVYTYLSILFTLFGLFVAFFLLQHLITTTIPLSSVRLYFILFTLSFSINYLLYYKRSLLYAEQRNRVNIIVETCCQFVFRSIQIVLIIVYHQYVLFLLLTILEKIICNIICNQLVNKRFPYLRGAKDILPKEKKIAIFNTIKPLFVNQIANTVQLSSRSILISMLLGNVAIVGYFGNYQLITNVVQMIYGQFGGAFTSSFGNLAVDNDTTRMRQAYYKSAFVMNWIASICCACFIACIQDFIYVVFGQQFVLGIISVSILTVNLIIYLMNIPMISVQNAMGLHRYDSKYMVIQAICAIALGYVGGKYWGMPGIFLGLLIPLIIFTFIRKGLVISRKALGISNSQYMSFVLTEFSKVFITTFVTFMITTSLKLTPSVGSIGIKFLIAIFLSIIIPSILSYKKKEFHDTINMMKNIVAKINK